MKMILSSNSSGLIPRCANFNWITWRICTVVCPGKIFHSNSNGSPSIPYISWWCVVPWKWFKFFLTCPWLQGVDASFQDKAQNLSTTCTLAFDSSIALSCSNVDLIHGVTCHSIVETCLISCFFVSGSASCFFVTGSASALHWIMSWAPGSRCSKLASSSQPEMNCCFHCRWHEWSPDYHIDLEIQNLVVFRTIHLLLHSREDFLKVGCVEHLWIVMGQSCPCESILYFSPRFLGAWALIHISPRFLDVWTGSSHFDATHENWMLLFLSYLASISRCLKELNSNLAFHNFTGCMKNPNRASVIDSRSLFSNQTYWLPFRQHSFFSWFFFSCIEIFDMVLGFLN